MLLNCLLLVALSGLIECVEYHGIKLGSLQNDSFGLKGDVWLVNETALQITDLSLNKRSKQVLSFIFLTTNNGLKATQMYRLAKSPGGEYLTPIENDISNKLSNETIVITIPGSYKKWKHFGLTAQGDRSFISSVKVNKQKNAPEEYCCITDANNKEKGIVGSFYSVGSDPIRVIDSRTLILPHFSFEGTKPPDGYIFVGKDDLDKDMGKKVMVIGHDTPNNICPLREDYFGDKDVMVRLGSDESVYDIDYLSVYCYEFAANFGTVHFKLSPKSHAVPPHIPGISSKPPSFVHKTTC